MAVMGVGGSDGGWWQQQQGMAYVRKRRGGSDGDIAVDIVLQRFKMKGEKKNENLSSWHQIQQEGDGNCRTKE